MRLTSQSAMLPYSARAAGSSAHHRSAAVWRAGLLANVPGGDDGGEGGGGHVSEPHEL